MKRHLERIYVGVMLGLALTLVWSVWASAQTNSAPLPSSNTVSATSQISHAMGLLEKPEPILFGLDHVPWFQRDFLGNPLWKYIGFALYIFGAFYISKLIDWIVCNWLKKLTAKTETDFDDLLLQLLHGPLKVVAFVILLHIGLNLFNWPVWVSEYLSKGLKLVVACSLSYVALKFIDLVVGIWRTRAGTQEGDKALNEMLYPVIAKSIKAFVLVVAVLLTSQNLGLNITSVLASLSIGGLALGLAAQDTVANIFGAVAVFMDKPFRIGDRIRLEGGVDGVVENMGLRSTRIRSLDGFLITVPNKTMGNSTITNITLRPTIKTEIVIGLTYDTSAERIRLATRLLDDIYRTHPMTHDVLIGFNKFADFSLNIQVVHWWKGTDYKAYLEGMQELNLVIKERFDKERLDFAFPTQTLYLRQDVAAKPA